jgi:hypothetical protein
LYPSPSTIRMNKSRRMRWAGHVAPKKKTRDCVLDIGEKAGRKQITKKTKS